MTRLTISSFSAGLDSAILLIVANVKMLPLPMLPVPMLSFNLLFRCYHTSGENARKFL